MLAPLLIFATLRPSHLQALRAPMLFLACGAVLAGCRGDGQPAGLARERFVEAYIGLVRARIDAAGDSAAYAAARAEVLRRNGVSAEELRQFVEAGRERPEELRSAWQAITAKLDTLYGGVTSEPPPELRALGLRPAEAAEGEPPQPDPVQPPTVVGDTLPRRPGMP